MANISYLTTILLNGEMVIWNILSAPMFWTAIESLAALGTFVLLMIQIPAYRKQMALHNLEGIKFIQDQFNDKDYVIWKNVIIGTWKQPIREFPNVIYNEIVNIFARIDGIHLFLKRGVVDKELFMELFASEIYDIERPIHNFETLPGSKIMNVRSSYPGAYELMIECREYERKKTKKRFGLLEKLQSNQE